MKPQHAPPSTVNHRLLFPGSHLSRRQQRIQFIQENDGRGSPTRLFEQQSQSALGIATVLAQAISALAGKEGHRCGRQARTLAHQCPYDVGLPAARRPVKQNAPSAAGLYDDNNDLSNTWRLEQAHVNILLREMYNSGNIWHSLTLHSQQTCRVELGRDRLPSATCMSKTYKQHLVQPKLQTAIYSILSVMVLKAVISTAHQNQHT